MESSWFLLSQHFWKRKRSWGKQPIGNYSPDKIPSQHCSQKQKWIEIQERVFCVGFISSQCTLGEKQLKIMLWGEITLQMLITSSFKLIPRAFVEMMMLEELQNYDHLTVFQTLLCQEMVSQDEVNPTSGILGRKIKFYHSWHFSLNVLNVSFSIPLVKTMFESRCAFYWIDFPLKWMRYFFNDSSKLAQHCVHQDQVQEGVPSLLCIQNPTASFNIWNRTEFKKCKKNCQWPKQFFWSCPIKSTLLFPLRPRLTIAFWWWKNPQLT